MSPSIPNNSVERDAQSCAFGSLRAPAPLTSNVSHHGYAYSQLTIHEPTPCLMTNIPTAALLTRIARIVLPAGIAWLLAYSSVALGQEAPYRGPGGQLEAMGAVAAVFAVSVATLDACARLPAHRLSAQRLGNAYLARNKPIYISVMQRMPALAQKNSGDAEVLRLKSELETGLTSIENFARGAADGQAQKPNGCASFLKRIEAKELDLNNTNPAHLHRLGL